MSSLSALPERNPSTAARPCSSHGLGRHPLPYNALGDHRDQRRPLLMIDGVARSVDEVSNFFSVAAEHGSDRLRHPDPTAV